MPEREIVLREISGSSNIQKVGYDETNNVLRVVFIKGDATWDYYGVPPQIYADMMKAESIGKFFHARVRPAYAGRKREENHGE